MKKLYKLWAIMAAIFMVGFVALSVNAQTNKEVQVEITWWTDSCTFNDYQLMQTGFSYDIKTLESNISGYECRMEEGGQNAYVTVQSKTLYNFNVDTGTYNIPDTNVKIKHVVSTTVSEWSCAISNTLATDYVDVSTAGAKLFEKDDFTVCTVTGSTQLEVTVPASLPVWTYTGDMVFTIY